MEEDSGFVVGRKIENQVQLAKLRRRKSGKLKEITRKCSLVSKMAIFAAKTPRTKSVTISMEANDADLVLVRYRVRTREQTSLDVTQGILCKGDPGQSTPGRYSARAAIGSATQLTRVNT
jgi:hypothetical protein